MQAKKPLSHSGVGFVQFFMCKAMDVHADNAMTSQSETVAESTGEKAGKHKDNYWRVAVGVHM